MSTTTEPARGLPLNTPMHLPNDPAPILPAAETETDVLETLTKAVNSLHSRISAVETTTTPPVTTPSSVTLASVTHDIATLFGHLGLGKPKSATK